MSNNRWEIYKVFSSSPPLLFSFLFSFLFPFTSLLLSFLSSSPPFFLSVESQQLHSFLRVLGQHCQRDKETLGSTGWGPGPLLPGHSLHPPPNPLGGASISKVTALVPLSPGLRTSLTAPWIAQLVKWIYYIKSKRLNYHRQPIISWRSQGTVSLLLTL